MKIDKDNRIFAIVFTFFATFVLVFPLTLAYSGTKPLADAYWRLQHYAKTLRALGLEADMAKPKEVEAAYAALEKFKEAPGAPGSFVPATEGEILAALEASSANGAMASFYYRARVGEEERWAGNFVGPGLWGNVALALGLSAGDRRLLGLEVLYQVETPGLGGRITEKGFTGQFVGLSGREPLLFNQSGQKSESGFDAISGATITSTAVRDIINQRALPALDALIAAKGGK